jgi:cytochrome c biogenesis protein CcmG, thiol:disulfide interchange protein DsbE
VKNYLVKTALICLTVFLIAAAPLEEKRSIAPNFRVKDLDQITVELSSFKNKNNVVLFFWTTWCPYCLQALKNLNQTIGELKKEGIIVLPINAGETPEKVANFAARNGYTFRIFLDADSAVSDGYQIYGVPTYLIVDKKGFVRSASNFFPQEELKKLAREK